MLSVYFSYACWALAVLALPMGLQLLVRRYQVFRALGEVVLCYIVGILLANLADAAALLDLPAWPVPPQALMRPLVLLSIAVSVPLMLFTAHFRLWLRWAPASVAAYGLAVLCALLAAGLWWYPFRHMPEATQMAGMVAGVFIGGSVNLNAVGIALGAQPETILLSSGAEMLSSLGFMFFTLQLAHRLLGRYYRPYPGQRASWGSDTAGTSALSGRWLLQRVALRRALLLALGIALLSVVSFFGLAQALAAGGLAPQLIEELTMPYVMMMVTALGVLVSLLPLRRRLQGAQHMGDYLMLVFCVAFGTMIRVGSLATLVHLQGYLLYASLVLVTMLLLHYLLCYWTGLDWDTMIMAQVASIQSAPFVSMFAESLRNREIVLSGLTSAIAGYAVGTYLGIALHYLLRWIERWLG